MPTLKEILTDLRNKSMNLERPLTWASVNLPRGLRVHYEYSSGTLLLERNDVTPSDQELSTVIKHFPVTLHPDYREDSLGKKWILRWHDQETDHYYVKALVKEIDE